MRRWINYGFDSSRVSSLLGTNGKMSEYDAAVANARLDGWEKEEGLWRERRLWVEQVSQEIGLSTGPDSMNTVNPYWIGVCGTTEKRENAVQSLNAAGIETRLWWGAGLRSMPAFESIPHESLAVADQVASRYLGLPFFLDLDLDNFRELGERLREFV